MLGCDIKPDAQTLELDDPAPEIAKDSPCPALVESAQRSAADSFSSTSSWARAEVSRRIIARREARPTPRRRPPSDAPPRQLQHSGGFPKCQLRERVIHQRRQPRDGNAATGDPERGATLDLTHHPVQSRSGARVG